MPDIFVTSVASLYTGDESVRAGFPNHYPPKFSAIDPELESIVAPSATRAKWGVNSLRFTGAAGGYIQTSSGVGAVFTQEAWVYPDSVSGVFAIFGKAGSDATGAADFAVLQVNNSLALYDGSTGFATLPAGVLTAATWHHVAWTVNAGKVHSLFLNGAKIASFTASSSSSRRSTVGQNNSCAPTYPTVSAFVGNMDDVRLSAVVRYVNDFTAPSAEFSLVPGSSAQGDGVSAGASSAEAFGVSQIIRQGDGTAAGTSPVAGIGARIRSGTGSAAGLAGAAAESDNDANPPTTAVTVSFAATIEADTVTVESIVSTWSAATTQAGSIVLDGALNAAPVFAATWATQQELSAELFALVRMLGTLPQQNDRGLAWVVNTLTGGTSMYEGFDFNSFGKVDTAYLGCKSDGIYVLDGDDDNGTPIQASVSFGKTDLGSNHVQRMIKAYADLSSTAPMTLKITANGEEFLYPARDFDEALTTQRFDVGRGLEARYFTFEIFNTDGCDFTLSNAEFLTNDVMHRRI